MDAQEIKSLYDQLREKNKEFLKNPLRNENSIFTQNSNKNVVDSNLLVELEKLLNEKEGKLQELMKEVMVEKRGKNQFKAQSEEVYFKIYSHFMKEEGGRMMLRNNEYFFSWQQSWKHLKMI